MRADEEKSSSLALELAVFANPRIAAHVDRGAPGLAKQRLRPFGRSVNELRAEFGRRRNSRYRMRQHATADAIARFEQSTRSVRRPASRSRQTRRAGTDDDDICVH